MNNKSPQIVLAIFALFILGVCSYAIHHDNETKRKNAEERAAEEQRKAAEELSFLDSVRNNRDINLCLAFLRKYYETTHRTEVEDILKTEWHKETEKLLSKPDSASISHFYFNHTGAAAYAATEDVVRLKSKIDYYANEYQRKEEKRKFGTESAAWQTAVSMQSELGYTKYLEYYPKGKHANEAEKRLIDLQVKNIFAGAHGQLPDMDKVGYGYGATSKISVHNNTGYTLTLLYSGNDSKRLVLKPNQKGNISLKNGKYYIAASVNSSNVSSYGGVENLSGGQYSVQYYISSSRYSSPSRSNSYSYYPNYNYNYPTTTHRSSSYSDYYYYDDDDDDYSGSYRSSSSAYDAGYEKGEGDGYYDGSNGYSNGYSYDDSDCYGKYSSDYEYGYESGYQDGYNSGSDY